MRHTWWRIPAFCSIAGWVDYHIKVWLFGRWTVVTLPDGSITVDDVKWAWLSLALMALTVVVGGLLICRSMTRRKVFASASVLVGINIVTGLMFMQLNNMVAIYWSQFTEWEGGISRLLYQAGAPEWLITVIIWALPYLFVPFGRAGEKTSRGAAETASNDPN